MEAEWNSLPMYMGYKDVINLGFKKTTVYEWFKCADFPPVINRNGKRVNKYKLREWLEKQEMK